MHRRGGRTNIQRFLCILPKDIDAFLRPYTVINKTVLTLLMMQVGSPFVLPEAMLPLSIDELLARIRTQYAGTIHTYGIELRKEYKGSLSMRKVSGPIIGNGRGEPAPTADLYRSRLLDYLQTIHTPPV